MELLGQSLAKLRIFIKKYDFHKKGGIFCPPVFFTGRFTGTAFLSVFSPVLPGCDSFGLLKSPVQMRFRFISHLLRNCGDRKICLGQQFPGIADAKLRNIVPEFDAGSFVEDFGKMISAQACVIRGCLKGKVRLRSMLSGIVAGTPDHRAAAPGIHLCADLL